MLDISAKIYVKPEDVWEFSIKNKEKLRHEMAMIAENEYTGYSVYLDREGAYPSVIVCNDKEETVYDELCVSGADCEGTVEKVYAKYIDDVEDSADGDEYAQRIEDELYERTDELTLATADFLSVVLQEGDDGTGILQAYPAEFVNDVLGAVVCYLEETYGFKVPVPNLVG